MDVIGAGLGRTGTSSLKLALEQVGFDKCYHMRELLLENPQHLTCWEQAFTTGTTDWKAIFTGYLATVDYPAALYYRDLTQTYPDAKVILTVRDPERWYESVRQTIFATSEHAWALDILRWVLPPIRERYPIFKYVNRLIWDGQFEGRFKDKAFAIATFKQWNESVKATVPANKLLVFEVKQGWQPLCDFLGVPVPDTEFPHANSREEFRQIMRQQLSIANLFKRG